MTNKISVVVSILCEGTPEVMNTIQERFEVYVAITGYSVEEIMDDSNLLDELNRFINNELVNDLGLEYGSVIINIGYNNLLFLLTINMEKGLNMKEIIFNKREKEKKELIANILQGYCDEIYAIYEKHPETAIDILNGGFLSGVIYDILITREMKKYSFKNDIFDINRRDLKATILYWHQEHIIELVMRNLKQDKNQDPIYWKLKFTVI
ncbi:Uncharacterised protein [Klebsiella pneumoniae]|nr:hypothetical protein KLPP_24230 [Klebsiella pneumoniae subsp. pneumoniae]CTQ31197.1 conserved hypothetical protein [Klebsiella pneumoniae]SLV31173.1 Uncharacterised protein [Klebsiella pneumoniae]SLV31592.1 Uncharacterised protein [Klebsiella pneumoniae]SLV43298.1 Uncharacterised protein [Klebsiella pneumoniae]